MKRVMFVIVLFFFVFAMASCGQKSNTIKIGFVNSLAYNFGNLGVDSLYGAMLAIEEINADGGVNGAKLELIIGDDERDSDEAVIQDNLLKEEGVVVIIGHGYSLTAEDAELNATENDILFYRF